MRASKLSNNQLIQKLESGKKWLTKNVHVVGKPYNSDGWEMNLRIFAQLVDEAEKRGIKFDTDWFIPLIFQDRETGVVPEWLDKPRPTIKSIAVPVSVHVLLAVPKINYGKSKYYHQGLY